MDFAELRKKVAKASTRRVLLQEQLEAQQKELILRKERVVGVEEVLQVFQTASTKIQEKLRFQVTDIVQTAVDTVFPGRYIFCMEFSTKNNRTFTSIYLERDGLRMDPMTCNGGGVGDLVALGLRMACWTIGRTANTLIMDEPYKNLSANFRPIMGEILKTLSKRLGLQVILVTHDAEIINIADRVFHLTLKHDPEIRDDRTYLKGVA